MENQQNLTMEWHEIPTTNDKMQEKKNNPNQKSNERITYGTHGMGIQTTFLEY